MKAFATFGRIQLRTQIRQQAERHPLSAQIPARHIPRAAHYPPSPAAATAKGGSARGTPRTPPCSHSYADTCSDHTHHTASSAPTAESRTCTATGSPGAAGCASALAAVAGAVDGTRIAGGEGGTRTAGCVGGTRTAAVIVPAETAASTAKATAARPTTASAQAAPTARPRPSLILTPRRHRTHTQAHSAYAS